MTDRYEWRLTLHKDGKRARYSVIALTAKGALTSLAMHAGAARYEQTEWRPGYYTLRDADGKPIGFISSVTQRDVRR